MANAEATPGGPGPRAAGRWRRWGRACRAHPVRLALGGALLGLGVTSAFLDAILAGPVRTWAERAMNEQLKGYTVRIGRARPHIWKLGFELERLTLVQTSHPDPPVADIGGLAYDMQLGGILRFKVAGKLTILHPALHINLAQIEEEATSHGTLKNRGWQGALEAIYPIQLNQVKVIDGSLVYLDAGSADRPLQITQVSLLAENVRNVAAAKGTLPSKVTLDGTLFDTGKVGFKGAADFLREPYLAVAGQVSLKHVPLDRLQPLAEDYQLKTKGGFLSVDGELAYGPEIQQAVLRLVRLEDLAAEYVTSKATKPQEVKHGKQAVKLAKQLRDAPKFLLQVDTLELAHSEIGFRDASAKPPYRLFFADVALKLEHLSNHGDLGRSHFQAHGAFMGSGATTLVGDSRLTASPADVKLRLRMVGARLADLNPYLKANAGFDVAGGQLSMYSEFTISNGRLEGYCKPLVKDLKIYDRAKDGDKPLGQRVKLHVLQVLGGLFKNRSTKEVATVINISGSTSDPKSSGWQVVRGLIENGLFQAIRPGFLAPAAKPAPAKPPSRSK
jgi:hypothetical protein